jgi:hypothetical protein
MKPDRRSMLSFLVTGLTVALAGCGPQTVEPMSPTAAVDLSITAVTLADNCPTAAAARPVGDCAAPPAGDAGSGRFVGCGGFCRQTSMQWQIVAGAGMGSARIDVVTVRLLDAATNVPLETPIAREPGVWNEASSMYNSWDQSIAYGTTLRTLYKLSGPTWSSHGESTGRFASSRRYRLEVVVRVDGVARTIRSGEVLRESEIVT